MTTLSKPQRYKRKNTPTSVRPIRGDEAWFYENAKSIDVYVYKAPLSFSCRIPRAKLVDWIRRTES